MSGDLPIPKVDIIVPVYNAEKFIAACIDSLLSQTYSNVEIIMVYSKSTDNTLRVLEKYRTKIKLIKQEKKNPAIARNEGLRHANGKYIAFCDADDFFAPEKIEKQVMFLENNPDIGLVYTDTIRIDHNGNEIDRIRSHEWDRDYWLSHRFITFSSVVLRKCLLDKIGYFDPQLDAVEDFDLLIRLSEVTEFKRIPEFLTYYRVHATNLSNDINKVNIARKNVFKKHKMYKQYISHLFWLIPMDYTKLKIREHPALSYFFRKIKKLIFCFQR